MTVPVSLIIPARNEAALIGETLTAARIAVNTLAADAEIIVVDNGSTDRTASIVIASGDDPCIRLRSCERPGSAAARNVGAQDARGEVLVFADADTLVPPDALRRIVAHCKDDGYLAGITGLGRRDGGWRAGLWWWFWSQVRRLPLPRAKAMPALMFCTREAFQRFGPFDERISIGEEWPILAGIYRAQPRRFIYDRTLIARTSSRRMELQRFGYVRTFGRYVWAVLHHSGRVGYPDTVRHAALESQK